MSIELWRTRPYTNPLGQALDRLFEQTFVPYGTAGLADGGSTGYQSLPVNVWETEAAYHAALIAPGLDEQTMKARLPSRRRMARRWSGRNLIQVQRSSAAHCVWERPLTRRRSRPRTATAGWC